MPTVPHLRFPSLRRLAGPIALALVLGAVFSLVWIRTRVMEVRYEIGELERARAERLSRQRQLIASRTAYAAPSRIAYKARKLGLTAPDRARVFRVRYEPRVVRVRARRGAAARPTPRL